MVLLLKSAQNCCFQIDFPSEHNGPKVLSFFYLSALHTSTHLNKVSQLIVPVIQPCHHGQHQIRLLLPSRLQYKLIRNERFLSGLKQNHQTFLKLNKDICLLSFISIYPDL